MNSMLSCVPLQFVRNIFFWNIAELWTHVDGAELLVVQ